MSQKVILVSAVITLDKSVIIGNRNYSLSWVPFPMILYTDPSIGVGVEQK